MIHRTYSLRTSLGNLSNMAARHMDADLNRRFAEAGWDMTVEKWRVLIRLHFEDGLSQNEIAARLYQEKTGVSRLVKALEEKGFVRRVRDEHDARSKRVFLTDKGRECQEPLKLMVMATLDRAERGIDPDMLATCRRVLGLAIDNLRGTST